MKRKRKLLPALKHGAYMSPATFRRLDGRTRLGKAFKAARNELEVALGDDLSPQQAILVDRVCFLLFRITAYENEMLSLSPNTAPPAENHYLSWVNSLRRTLESLGLKRKARKLETLKGLLDETD